MIKSFKAQILNLLILCFSLNGLYALNCSSVEDIKKWNGHYYTITTKRMTFLEAKQFAKANGGYLAIPNSPAENKFLQSLIPKPEYAWIGVYDPNYMTNYCYSDAHCAFDDSRFVTIKGQPLTYKNWAKDQPDNLVEPYDIMNGKALVSPLGEHWVAMASTNGKWADFGNHADKYNNPVKFFALIEFDKQPDCYTPPSNVSDEYKGAKCNTQIYDKTSGNLQNGKTYTCLQDKYGHYYCPAALAPCGQEWDYKNGYSINKSKWVFVGKPTVYDSNKCINSNNQICVKSNFITNIVFTIYYDSTPFASCDKVKIVKTNYGHTFNWKTGIGVYYNNIDKALLRDMGISTNYIVNSQNLKNWLQNVWSDYGGDCQRGIIYGPKRIVIKANISAYKIYKCFKGVLRNGDCYAYKNYYEYKCSGKNYYGEPYVPIVTNGNSQTPPANNCKAKNFVCKPAPNRKCVWVDKKWQCSPFPCFGEGVGDYNVTSDDTPVGVNDANNNGWNANGTCSGTIYIFNGKDMRCRSSDAFFGLTGGGCCNKDKVFFGLVACNQMEKELAKKREEGMCHYVGEYCSKKVHFLVGSTCVQHKQTYCCFNSKLARIINEQGREQLHKGWGTPESPNCRGFTPEQFQKLDFSKMDLSEFYNDLKTQISNQVLDNMSNYIKNSINNQLKEIQSR